MDDRLHDNQIERTGEVTQPRLRPWGTVLHADTTRGPVWLKAPGPETVFEVELYQLLHRVVPDWVLPPIAVDVERGWIVLPDGGTPLGERLDDAELIDALAGVLPQYGQLQRDLAPHVDGLLSFGVTDMRAAVMPERFDEAIAAVGGYVDRFGDAADRDIHRRVAAKRNTVISWCERLGDATVPPSVDHNDLHPWNIFLSGTGRARFYDWGDAVVAHPFASMLVGLGFLHHAHGTRAGDPSVLRLRDAYLEVWSDLAPRAELIEELDLACWVAVVARSLTWERAVRLGDDDEPGEFTRAPLECLAALLTDSWMASA